MKKFSLILLMTILLVGCSSANTDNVEAKVDSRFKVLSIDDNIDEHKIDIIIIQDTKTGCQYALSQVGMAEWTTGGITPLLNPAGTPKCGWSSQ